MAEANLESSSSSGSSGDQCSDFGSDYYSERTPSSNRRSPRARQNIGHAANGQSLLGHPLLNASYPGFLGTRSIDEAAHAEQIREHDQPGHVGQTSSYQESFDRAFDGRLQTDIFADRVPISLGVHKQDFPDPRSLSEHMSYHYSNKEPERASFINTNTRHQVSRYGQYGSREKYQVLRQPEKHTSGEIQVKRAICFFMHKCNKIGYADVRNFSFSSASLSAETVVKAFNVHENDVCIVENVEVPTWDPAGTFVILDKHAATSTQFLIVEILMRSEQPYPTVVCVRIPAKGILAKDLGVDISREISVRKVVMSENGCVLGNETVIRNNNGQVRILKAIHNSRITTRFVHQPANNVKSKYELEVDFGTNIRQLKEEFLRTFKENINLNENTTVHFSFRGTLLDDDMCLGVIIWPSREGAFQVHVASPRAICANLLIKETAGRKALKPRSIAIEPDMPTAALRKEVSRHMTVDPKAVKLTVNNRRIEEVDSIANIRGIENGCKLVAGIKKRKAIRVKNAGNNREETFCMYMLDPVHVLKRMIAEKFDIELLHVSLVYKGRRLEDNELLLNYPIKNQTEISLHVYPKRIKLNIYIVFKKTRTVLLVDNADKTTVDDLVRFCAITYNFDRRCARVQCHHRCLSKFSTLTDEYLQTDRNMMIVFFDQPEKLDGGLIRIFSVRPDGQINARLGTVSGGHLLHASKKVKAQCTSQQPNEGEQLPVGIRVYEDLHVPEEDSAFPKPKKEIPPTPNPMSGIFTAAQLKALKKKFMARAIRIRESEHVGTRTVPRPLDQPRPELEEESRMVSNFSPIHSLNTLEVSSDSETDLKRVCPQRNVSTSPTEEDGSSVIAKHVSCIQNCCTQIKNVIDPSAETERCTGTGQTSPSFDGGQMIRNPESFITEETGEGISKPAFGEISSSASDLQMTHRNVEFTLGSDSSDQGAMAIQVNQIPHSYGLTDFSRCPYMYVQQMRARGASRRRTRTEGEIILPDHSQDLMPHTNTYPGLHPRYPDDGNEWLNTAGITIDILYNVSRKVGRNWKNLARKLLVPEEDIENIEASNRDLQDKAFESILFWKKCKGTSASRERLIEALQGIEMLAVAEYIEQFCEYTTV